MKPFHFAILRMLSAQSFRSGEAIAHALGVSRATVWNGLREIEAAGVQVFKLPGVGYRLALPIEWLDRTAILAAMGDAANTVALELAEAVASTNSQLLAAAAEERDRNCCLAAEWQAQGRGRRGRYWYSAPGGGLTFSVRWRFQRGAGQLAGLSLAVGVALCRALSEVGLSGTQLKWPNDLVHGYRKLGGVLIELQGDAYGPTDAVIGIGVNVRLPAAVRDRIDQAVVDWHALTDTPPGRNRVLGRMLAHLADVLQQFDRAGFAPLRDEWQALHAYHAKRVTVSLPGGVVRGGIVRGVAEDGGLLLEQANGIQRFDSGELSLRLAGDFPQAEVIN